LYSGPAEKETRTDLRNHCYTCYRQAERNEAVVNTVVAQASNAVLVDVIVNHKTGINRTSCSASKVVSQQTVLVMYPVTAHQQSHEKLYPGSVLRLESGL